MYYDVQDGITIDGEHCTFGAILKDKSRWEVMQFTGIHDKNGKEVYNCDIVRCHKFTQEVGENLGIREGEREFTAVIEFTIYGGVQVVLPDGEFMFIWEYEEGWHEESLEVIGNIQSFDYENPNP